MPGKGLISSLTEKAQAAVAGLSGTHKDDGPPASAGSSAGGSGQYQAPPDKEQSGTLSGRHYGLETIQHHLRTLQVQYSSGVSQENRQLQLLITATKGVALDIDAAGRDAKSQSKELFLWGQTQDADIKDVTDRLAYLNFVQGALSYTLATDIDKSRVVWKNVRDAEAALAPRRLQRSNISTQINKFKTEGGKAGGIDQRLADLEAQLKKAEADDAPLEHEIELLKRTAIKESETLKWKALSEYAHKLLLLAGASEQLLKVLPSSRLAEGEYKGHQQTAAVRAALQNALDSGYIPEPAHLPLNVGQPAGETRSFGETHASELSTIQTVTDNGHEAPHGAGGADRRASQDTARPIDPTALNNAPAHIPAPSRSNVPPTGTAHYKEPSLPPSGHFAAPSTAPPSAFHDSPTHKYAPPATGPPSGAADLAAASTAAVAGSHTSVHSTGVTGSSTSVPHGPTVAETGVPVSAGAEGPGPAAGNLHDIAHQHSTDSSSLPGYGGSGNAANAPGYTATGATGGVGYSSFASAEEEKRRLRAAQEGEPTAAHPPGGLGVHQGGLVASTSTRRPNTHQPATTEHESAEDEKKRLEREERERVLRGDGNAGAGSNLPHREPTQDDGAEGPAPPAYQD